MNIEPQFWNGKRVLVTGHTGFKGSWLSIWLARLGAEIFGYALAPERDEDMFAALDLPVRLGNQLHHTIGDVRNLDTLTKAVSNARPDIIIHMAAQALVRRSYTLPADTFATNVMGTVNVLETARSVNSIKAIVVVTTDKVYENLGHELADSDPYAERDRLGGYDPYSASKAASELAVSAYRRSYFSGGPAIATVRAGNVIGGGDWSEDRLIADAMRAWRNDTELVIRSPHATRPWQHVIDPLRGYLILAQALAAEGSRYAQAWNFGPDIGSVCDVQELIERLAALLKGTLPFIADESKNKNEIKGSVPFKWRAEPHKDQPHEAARLQLDCRKAQEELQWRPKIDLDAALNLTAEWYRAQIAGASPEALFELTREQIGQ